MKYEAEQFEKDVNSVTASKVAADPFMDPIWIKRNLEVWIKDSTPGKDIEKIISQVQNLNEEQLLQAKPYLQKIMEDLMEMAKVNGKINDNINFLLNRTNIF